MRKFGGVTLRLLVAVAIAWALAPSPAHGATGTAVPFVKPQYFDNNGDPCNGCKVYVYVAGTSTPTTTFSDAGLLSANTSPVVLDSAGRANIFLTPGESVKVVLAPASDTNPPTSPIFTVDSVAAIPASNVDVDISATAGEALAAGDLVYLSQGDGGRTSGRWYKADADLDYASVTANSIGFAVAAISSAATGTVRVTGRMTGLSGLSIGSVYYASATAGGTTTTPPTLARKVGVADSTTSMLMSHWVPFVDATASVAGLVSITSQDFEGVKNFKAPPTFEPGTSTTTATMSGVISVNTTTVGNVGAGEDDLMSYTLPANVLSANGKYVRVTMKGSIASSANTKEPKAYYGGTLIYDGAADFGDSNARFWTLTIHIIRTGASSQITWTDYISYNSNSATSGAIIAAAEVRGAVVTTAIDTTATAIIKATGTATADNEITQNAMLVEVLN